MSLRSFWKPRCSRAKHWQRNVQKKRAKLFLGGVQNGGGRGLRPCLHGVGDPGLVGWVSFVLCPPERENKRNQPH